MHSNLKWNIGKTVAWVRTGGCVEVYNHPSLTADVLKCKHLTDNITFKDRRNLISLETSVVTLFN